MNWNKAVGNKSEETQREKVMENIVETLRDFEDRMRRLNMHIINLRRRTEKMGCKNIQRDNKCEFLEVNKDLNPQTQRHKIGQET